MKNSLTLLDCSLRDGGFSIDFAFGRENILRIMQLLINAKIDAIEFGMLRSNIDYDPNLTLFSDFAQIAALLAKIDKKESSVAAFIQYPDYNIADLPINDGLIDLIRMAPRYSELNDSLDFMRKVAAKGYIVSIQLPITARYKPYEIDMCIKAANEIGAYSIYIVDTFGYLNEEDVERFFDRFNRDLDASIKLGYHSHNNMTTAFTNTRHFIKYAAQRGSLSCMRDIIVDSTTFGIGQGPGNLQTELIVGANLSDRYDILYILDACEIIERYNRQTIWGYSIVDLIGALTKVSYKYPHYFRKEKQMSYRDIYALCKSIPDIDDMPARFNKENAQEVLRMSNL
jgi:4-hydroxy 2-oxovalerate aldolase